MGLPLGRRMEICYTCFHAEVPIIGLPYSLEENTERDGQCREQFVLCFQENWQHSNHIRIQNYEAGGDLYLRTEFIAERGSLNLAASR